MQLLLSKDLQEFLPRFFTSVSEHKITSGACAQPRRVQKALKRSERYIFANSGRLATVKEVRGALKARDAIMAAASPRSARGVSKLEDVKLMAAEL